MPAVSKKQRMAAGMAEAIKKGKMKGEPGMPATEMAKSMKSGDLHKFASTSEKGLPEKAPRTPKAKGPKMINVGEPIKKMRF